MGGDAVSASESVSHRSASPFGHVRGRWKVVLCTALGALGGAAMVQSSAWALFALSLFAAFLTIGRPTSATPGSGGPWLGRHARAALPVVLYWVALFTVSSDVIGEAFAANFSPGLFWRGLVALAAGLFTASGYAAATLVAMGAGRSPVARGAVLGAAVAMWEWARTELLHWPLGKIAYGLTDSPWLNTAPYLGAYGAGATFVALVAAAAWTLAATAPRPRHAASLAAAAAGLMLLLAAAGHGSSTPSVQASTVSVVLLRATPQQKYDRDTLRERTEAMLRRAEQSTGDVVVFPETSLPLPWDSLPAGVKARFHALSQHKTLVIGSFREANGSSFNTAVLLAPGEPVEFVDKRLLFIFSEYFPRWLQWAKPVMQMPYQDLSPGSAPQRAGPLPGVLICQDIGSPRLAARRAQGRQWLVLLSDMSWFPGRRAIAHQLAMARWRAAETRQWLLVAAVPGGSALIAPDGHVAQRAPEDADIWNVSVPEFP